jgi:hypothetical protein
MGAWGIGLYSSDFALDLRGSVKALARLPFAAERLLEFLCAAEPSAANNPKDSDHTVFWLTVADQFAKRGIECVQARDRALAIIAADADLATMAALGMDEKSLVKRRAMLEELRRRITAPINAAKSRRPVLKAPQRLLLAVGEVLAYPTCKGHPINPYAVGKELAWVKAWKQDGWGAFVVAERGLMFEYLAWYRPLVITEPLLSEPTLAELSRPRMWVLQNPGTLTARHYANMSIKSLGCVSIDLNRLAAAFPKRLSAMGCVVSDISISNNMSVRPLDIHESHRIKHGYPSRPRINALAEVAVAEGTVEAPPTQKK